ncbi:hypothetical protein P8936_16340 [Edaphobacter paludis]|uniref:Uncharacterized protein n=1 Tax=Edaphobacter paludis TaxID=3035702 RepID=A0AAU7D805_9BACT
MSTSFYPIAELNGADAAFGPRNLFAIMPKMDDIPQEFQRRSTQWNKLVSAWFFCGLKSLELTPKEGVDKSAALRHVKAIMASFEPKHEHKEAACAYLLSQWFTDPKWEVAK